MEKRILIIDDESDFCLIMKHYFRRKGYAVSTAGSLSDGLEKLNEFRPNFLFLDNNLPDGSGWDTVEKIVEEFPHIHTYLVSAHRNNSPLRDSHANLTVWEKPISMEMLNSIF